MEFLGNANSNLKERYILSTYFLNKELLRILIPIKVGDSFLTSTSKFDKLSGLKCWRKLFKFYIYISFVFGNYAYIQCQAHLTSHLVNLSMLITCQRFIRIMCGLKPRYFYFALKIKMWPCYRDVIRDQ